MHFRAARSFWPESSLLAANRFLPAQPSGDSYESRRKALAAYLANRKLDAALIAFGPNLRYLTGFTGDNGVLLAGSGYAVFFTDPRFRLQAAQEVDCRTKIAKGPLLPDVVAEVRRQRIRRLGFEPARTPYATYEFLKSHLPLKVSLEGLPGWLEERRMVKSADEIARVRQAVNTNSKAFQQGIQRVRAGVREQDLAAELEYRMRRLGAEKAAFETIVAGGERSALPHARPTKAALANHSLVVIDMGAFVDGYASDMTRMLHVGRPSERVRRLYRAVLEAQLAAITAARAGVTAAHVDAAARRVLRAEKLDHAFVHSTGHGLGLEIHEPPRLGKKVSTRLEPGMTVTIEPGVYLEGFGGIRIEDTVLITRTGCEVLTPTSKELIVI